MNLLKETAAIEKAGRGGTYTQYGYSDGPSPAQQTAAFPRGGLESESSRDELIREKQALMAGNANGMTPFGQVVATDADFKWLQRKQEKDKLAQLDSWIGTNFHVGDVTTRKWLQEVYPDYYEVREQQMMDRAKFALRVQLLLLRGPRNQKDLILLWGLQSGQIKLEKDWNTIAPSSNEVDFTEQEERFRNGLFTPRKFKTDVERGVNRDQDYNPFRPVDDSPAGGQATTFMGSGYDNYPAFLNGIIQ